MNDKPKGGHSRKPARKFEEDEEEPQLPARQDLNSIDDESDRMGNHGGSQRSTPSSSIDSFRSPEHFSFHGQAQQQQQQQDPSTDDQTHTPTHHHMPPSILPERPPNFARSGRPERPRPRAMGHLEHAARIERAFGCDMSTRPRSCKDNKHLWSVKRRRYEFCVTRGGGGRGGQTRQQAAAGQGQRQTATVHSQQPANQVQHPHNNPPSPAESGRVGEVKGAVDPHVSSSEGEEDDD